MKLSRNSKGFTLVEIMIVVAIIGLLAAIAVPNFLQARTTARTNACLNNLRLIDAAEEQWALENNKTAEDDAPTADDLDDYIKGEIDDLHCPSDPDKTFATSYTLDVLGTAPVCQLDPDVHTLTPAAAE